MPATAHGTYFSVQRALYDKGSAQGKQPEKLIRILVAASADGAVRHLMRKRHETGVVEPPGSTHNGYGLFPMGAARTCMQRN